MSAFHGCNDESYADLCWGGSGGDGAVLNVRLIREAAEQVEEMVRLYEWPCRIHEDADRAQRVHEGRVAYMRQLAGLVARGLRAIEAGPEVPAPRPPTRVRPSATVVLPKCGVADTVEL